MKIVGIVGHSDAGKTTLIERLIPRLGERGQVATIKSIHHDVDIEEEDKDTRRHRAAGAEKVIGVTPTLTFSIEPRGTVDYAEGVLLRRLFRELDDEGYEYVLVEGFTTSPIPKFIVGDAAVEASPSDVVGCVEDVDSVEIDALTDEIDAVTDWTDT